MRRFDGICPCGAEQMSSRCGNFANLVLDGGESSKYHCRICPTAIVCRYCLLFPLTYDPRKAVDGRFRGVSATAGHFAAVPISRGVRWRNLRKVLTQDQVMLMNGVASNLMHGDSVKRRFMRLPFDLYPLDKTALKLWGAKGPVSVDLGSRLLRSIVKIAPNGDGLDLQRAISRCSLLYPLWYSQGQRVSSKFCELSACLGHSAEAVVFRGGRRQDFSPLKLYFMRVDSDNTGSAAAIPYHHDLGMI